MIGRILTRCSSLPLLGSSCPSPLPTKLGTRPWHLNPFACAFPGPPTLFRAPLSPLYCAPPHLKCRCPGSGMRQPLHSQLPYPVLGGAVPLPALAASAPLLPSFPSLCSHRTPLFAHARRSFCSFRSDLSLPTHLLFSPPLRTRRTAARTLYTPYHNTHRGPAAPHTRAFPCFPPFRVT